MSISHSQQSLSDSEVDPISRALLRARSLLMDPDSSVVYLANNLKTIKEQTVWKHIGHGNQLFTKPSTTSVENSQPQGSISTQPDSTTDSNPNPLLQPCIFSAIVLINFDNCWLTPCGYWKGPTKVTKKFEDLKLSFQGKAPSQHFLSQDFDTILINSKSLMQETAVDHAKFTGFVVPSKSGGTAIRFRHVVFEKIADETNLTDHSDTASDTDDDWTMTNWPVISPEAEYERDRLASTHRPVPVPEYDIDGHLIPPQQCKIALAGAIARVTFTLTHWYINSGSKDESPPTNSYVADIQSIRVLVNPLSQTTSPKKRKTARRDPIEGSSTKKSKRF